MPRKDWIRPSEYDSHAARTARHAANPKPLGRPRTFSPEIEAEIVARYVEGYRSRNYVTQLSLADEYATTDKIIRNIIKRAAIKWHE